MMNLKNLEALYWVVTLNSFVKAANKLNTTQPAISQKITALENELGMKVLDRRARQISTTEHGLVLFKYAEKFMRLESDLHAELTEAEQLTGTIRLGVSESIVHTWLVDFVEKVRAKFPKVTLEIVVNLTPGLHEAVRIGELDMAFLLGPTLHFDCIEQALCDYEIGFLAAPSFQGSIGQMSLKSLMSHTILTYPKMTYPYKDLRAKMKEAQIDEPISISSYSLSTLLRLAEQGLGIVVVPTVTALKEIQHGILEIINTPVKLKSFYYTVIYTQGHHTQLKQQLATLAVATAAKAEQNYNLQLAQFHKR
ncbi:DNA-binding transcriptional LysR family regulator [Acinetobacter calcoaceticus]|uniref:DNA-binding transcriptional LysR family regulator n=1 Tax=Acinetobacter calcoaceticus TaxID=471 RepID=A0A4R1XAH4_ACICA|nr:DNA-binding transcriptional LysR family regulator [Acinetobacter calcoaceticus]